MLPFKIEKSGHTHGMLRHLPPGTAAAESKRQFSQFKSTRPQSDTRVHFRLFPHLLYIIKAHVISTEGDQPSWFSQDMRLLVLKLGKCQANQDELVTQLPTLPVAVRLSFTPLVILMICIYSLILQSSFSPSLAFRPLFMGLPGLSRYFRHHSLTPSVGCFVIAEDLAPKLVWELSTPLSAQMWQEKAIS